ncbi:MAG: hypothetical protein IPI93_14540 [Sphingobacteriaceae bacterium]|nr:hypothetical protein [Sphingobacteriaceae bacterium]
MKAKANDFLKGISFFSAYTVRKIEYDKNDSVIKVNIGEMRINNSGESRYTKEKTIEYFYKEGKLKEKIEESNNMKETRTFGDNNNVIKIVLFDKLKQQISETIITKNNSDNDVIERTFYDYLNEPKEHLSVTYEYW